jgi:hypothetical protein
MVLFEELLKSKSLKAGAIAEARKRWRLFGQLEMDSQCIGCEKICALVKYPESALAARSEASLNWDVLGAGRAAFRRRVRR